MRKTGPSTKTECLGDSVRAKDPTTFGGILTAARDVFIRWGSVSFHGYDRGIDHE